MRRKRLGKTNLEVSELALGTVELGLDYGISANGEARRPSKEEAATLLNYALDSGINLIDTARAYGDAEEIIRSALKGRREEYVLVSKAIPKPGQPELVKIQVEESLAALGTDRIDVMMIHCRADRTTPDDEALEQVDQLRKQGKVRFIGSSVYGPEAGVAAVKCERIHCVQVGYSALDRRIEAEMLPLAEANDIGVVARSVLMKGALSKRYVFLPDTLMSLKKAIEELAAVAGSIPQLPELAYRYVCGRNLPHSALIGTASRSEIDACIAYLARGPLSSAEMQAVRAIAVSEERWLNPGNWPV